MSRSLDTVISRMIALGFALLLALPVVPLWAQEDDKAPAEGGVNTSPYVRFAQIVVPIIEGNKVTKQIGVTLTLELFDAKARQEVIARRPLLTDAFVKFLYAFFQQRIGAKTPLDEAVLKDRLRQTAAKVVGPDMVKEVLIQQLFER